MTITNRLVPLRAGTYYHCTNHAIGTELLFRETENYFYFLTLYHKYITPIAATYAYCLMPNHFHFLFRIRSANAILAHHRLLKPKEAIVEHSFSYDKFLSQQFSNFFNAYSKAYNKYYKRRGSLFINRFKRTVVDTKYYFLNTLKYIHRNPIRHGFTTRLLEWEYSSYASYLTQEDLSEAQQEVVKLFSDRKAFIDFHSTIP
ncbi:MAG: hypothetical protein MK212_01535 [Saprospiraceae bacterium]|nr:hypothetical protein [Saprospiraceae bacterium]